MKIQYCSDLHLEFLENRKFLKANPILPVGGILILAGDITLLRTRDDRKYFFDYFSKNFKQVYWLPGNHEYYHSDINSIADPLLEEIAGNVFLINNRTVFIENVEIVFSTLWSHISAQHEWTVQKNVSDFFNIRKDGKNILASDFNNLHEKDLAYLKTELAKPTDNKRIVVTHHVPTFLNYPQVFKHSEINGAFATELFHLIENSNVDYWLYGHHHCNTADFKIGNTCMITNQLGYVHLHEHLHFDRQKLIEV